MKFKNIYLGSAAIIAVLSYTESFAVAHKSTAKNHKNVNYCEKGYQKYLLDHCLKISKYYAPNVSSLYVKGASPQYSYPLKTGVTVDYKNKTRLGKLQGSLKLQVYTPDLSTLRRVKNDSNIFTPSGTFENVNITLDELYLNLRGVQAGYYKPWSNEVSSVYDKAALNNDVGEITSLSYQRSFGLVKAGLSADILQQAANKRGFGIGYMASYVFGKLKSTVTGGYDTYNKHLAVRGNVSARLSNSSSFDFGALWANGKNSYYDQSQSSIFAGYKVNIRDNISISPGAQYFWDKDKFTTSKKQNSWTAGVGMEYEFSKDITVKLSTLYDSRPNKGVNVTLGWKHGF
ncbi:hypothetical protein C0030_002545 [Candidatus Liberibacter solanacearum]|uniref:Porin n=1 Tax=Candidatus Liberibacter solanacearum TaxID=556287 RepID=A0A424FMM8_9HYPH|nr:porin [Candidatus Liberibacter solanacearum]RPD37409.1 hypothetical protein C0030_002545 [Candidatus Liberibacter solanacearum]